MGSCFPVVEGVVETVVTPGFVVVEAGGVVVAVGGAVVGAVVVVLHPPNMVPRIMQIMEIATTFLNVRIFFLLWIPVMRPPVVVLYC